MKYKIAIVAGVLVLQVIEAGIVVSSHRDMSIVGLLAVRTKLMNSRSQQEGVDGRFSAGSLSALRNLEGRELQFTLRGPESLCSVVSVGLNLEKMTRDRTPQPPHIWQVADLPDLPQLQEFIDLPFEVTVDYTDQGYWLLITGGVGHALYPEYPDYLKMWFRQGRILIDIHSHPGRGKRSSLPHRLPSLGDVTFDLSYGNQSAHLSEEGMTFRTRAYKDVFTRGELNTVSLTRLDLQELYDDWRRIRKMPHRLGPYMLFLQEMGVTLETIPWEKEHQLREVLKMLDRTYDPLKKLNSPRLIDRLQAEQFRAYRASNSPYFTVTDPIIPSTKVLSSI